MHLSAILQVKGSTVFTIQPTASLADAAKTMVEDKCGSLVVCEGEQVVGIVTERDILRGCASQNESLDLIHVAKYMTREVIVGAPNDRISDIMGLMTNERIRHLPVLDNGKLAGIISIGDVVKAQHDQLSVENLYLKQYIQS